jgi:Mn2+/Fe2+ NRAMP family transporter
MWVFALRFPFLRVRPTLHFAPPSALREGLDEKFRDAQRFYLIIVASISIGMVLNFLNINPMRALFWTAVMNGVLAPFLLLGIIAIATDTRIMRGQPSSPVAVFFVACATLLMFAAAIAMFLL